jgi:dihydrofolate synthase/folylpolyglutamate synthase
MTIPREYLSRLNISVIRPGLAPITGLLESLNNPQCKYASVLIGGTNGKGSIAAMVDSVLRRSGYLVGLYTSPHLIDLRERIRVGGEMITTEALDGIIDDVRSNVREDVTYFEFLTAAAFLYFYRMGVDIAVLEVGMGGRLDATNVVKPIVSVISNISLEHKEYIGNTLADITKEKAGIIKEKGVCITAAKQKHVIGILNEICRKRQAKIYQLGRDIKVRILKDGSFNYYGINTNYQRLKCFLKGRHQIDNAALSIASMEILTVKGFPVDENAIRQGLQKTCWECRLEILQPSPMVLIDGAHNLAGISALCRALKENFSYQRLILIFGVLSDKNYVLMLKKLASLADAIIISTPKTKRAVTADKLIRIVNLHENFVEIAEPPKEALKRALALAGKDDLICATGSLYLVGEIKEAYINLTGRCA